MAKRLSKTEWRCAGIYKIGETDCCPERGTCLRYLAFLKYDSLNGINDYRDISVFMAVKGCKYKIEA